MILKKGLQVKVISGKDKGKTGEILEINRKLLKVKIKVFVSKISEKIKYIAHKNIWIIAKEKVENKWLDL